jgi:hypothetical protein
MANLLGQNIGTNYKGILSLDSTINTPLDATLRAVTDGEGNASPLELSTDAVSLGGATGANWDNTNNRLGIGTDAPISLLQVSIPTTGTILTLNNLETPTQIFKISKPFSALNLFDMGTTSTNFKIFDSYIRISVGSATTNFSISNNGNIGIGIGDNSALARVDIKGSGTTSATTSLLVQNSAGTQLLKVLDDGNTFVKNLTIDNSIEGSTSGRMNIIPQYDLAIRPNVGGVGFAEGFGFSVNGSALIEMQSTTKGFLPPRMTTTQKNAIATPASGLIVYDETTNKLACYNGTSWNDLF